MITLLKIDSERAIKPTEIGIGPLIMMVVRPTSTTSLKTKAIRTQPQADRPQSQRGRLKQKRYRGMRATQLTKKNSKIVSKTHDNFKF